MIIWNRLIETALVKQLPWVSPPPTPHVRPPSQMRPEDGITLPACFQPTFATLSGLASPRCPSPMSLKVRSLGGCSRGLNCLKQLLKTRMSANRLQVGVVLEPQE